MHEMPNGKHWRTQCYSGYLESRRNLQVHESICFYIKTKKIDLALKNTCAMESGQVVGLEG